MEDETYCNPLITVFRDPGRSRCQPMGRIFTCTYKKCKREFTRYRDYEAHCMDLHICNYCQKPVADLSLHKCKHIQVGEGLPVEVDLLQPDFDAGQFSLINSAHDGAIVVFKHNFQDPMGSIQDSFEHLFEDMLMLTTKLINIFRGVRVQININITMEHNETGKLRTQLFNSPFVRYTYASEELISSNILGAAQYVISSINLFTRDGSNWGLKSCNYLEYRAIQYRPKRGGTYIRTPPHLRGKQIINIRTRNGDCFILSVLACLYRHEIHLPEAPQLIYDELNYAQRPKLKRRWENPKYYSAIFKKASQDGIEVNGFRGEVSLDEIANFESINQIGVCVYGHLKSEAYPLRLCSKEFEKNVDLMLLKTKIDGVEQCHYTAVPHVGRLFGKKGRRRTEVCRFCLAPYTRGALKKHTRSCQAIGNSAMKFPVDDHYKFKNLFMQENVCYRVYYDFFCITKSSLESLGVDSTGVRREVVPFSYALVVLGPDGKLYHSKYYDGEACVEDFIMEATVLSDEISKIVSSTCVEITMTQAEMEAYESANFCSNCKLRFEEPDRVKCRHHNHFLRERAVVPLCSPCNLLLRNKPIIFISHNGSMLHHNLILQGLTKHSAKKIKMVSKNSQETIALILNGKYKLIDSKLFLNEDLDDLVENYKSQHASSSIDSVFPTTYQAMAGHLEKTNAIVNIKDLSIGCIGLSEAINHDTLPDRTLFYDILKQEEMSQAQYQAIVKLFETFECASMRDVFKFHLLARTLLLADVIVNLAKFTLENFNMSPLHCFSVSQFAYNVAMSSSRPFEYIKDPKMIDFFSAGVRGGILVSNKAISTANTPRLNCYSTVKGERREILNMDLNSSYANSSREYLPVGGYRWMTEKELGAFDYENPQFDTGKGYSFCVDIECPINVHDRDAGCPKIPHKTVIRIDQLSEVQKNFVRQNDDNAPFKGEVVTLDFHPKLQYSIYYKNLSYYIKSGYKLTRVHSGIEYDESPFLRDIIDKFLELRKMAKARGNTIGSNFIKSMYCNLVGKFLSSTKNHVEIQAVFSKARALKLGASHRFKDFHIVSEGKDVTFFELSRCSVTYAYPIACGFQVLELSKIAFLKGVDMIQETFPGSTLLNANTDGMAFEIRDPDGAYSQKLKSLSNYFDFSNLKEFPDLYDPVNADKPGYWKIVNHETVEMLSLNNITTSYLSLCGECKTPWSKDCNTCEVENGNTKVKLIPRAVTRRLSHSFYMKMLEKQIGTFVNYNKTMTTRNQMVIVPYTQRAFRHLNLRRFQLDDGITSLPHGHYWVMEHLEKRKALEQAENNVLKGVDGLRKSPVGQELQIQQH